MVNSFFQNKYKLKSWLVCGTILIFSNTIVYAAGQDNLWLKAVSFSEKSKNYRAKELTTHIYELQKDNTIKSETTVYQKLKPGNKTDYDTYKVIKDGKDVTTESLKKMKNKKSKDNFFDDTNFFSSENQQKITTRKTGNETFNGSGCSVYDITYQKDEKNAFKGKAWLNNTNGKPVKVSFGIDPLPMGLKKISILYLYGSEGENAYLEKIEVEGKAGILFFEKNFRMKTEFKKFR